MRLRYPSPTIRGARLLAACLCWLAGIALASLPAAAAEGRLSAADYLHRFGELKQQHGIATERSEGVVEVRGTIQGKLRSVQTTWVVRPEADEQAAYQLVSTWDAPDLPLGARVRAVGRGLAVPGAVLELLAITREEEMQQWEKEHVPPAPAPRPAPSQVIVLNPGGGAPAPAARKAPSSRPVPAQRPPRWQEPKSAAPASATRQTTRALPSRGWDPYIQSYAKAVRYFNPRLATQQAEQIARSILAYSVHYEIDPRLVVAVIAVESGFSTTATSPKGAMGLGQLMPGTAAGLGVRNAYDPVENIWGAVKLLRGHLKAYAGRPFWEQLSLALASYNAGSGAVKKYKGVPPYRETQRYIVKVRQLYEHLCGLRPKK